jgi:hypothetical protein
MVSLKHGKNQKKCWALWLKQVILEEAEIRRIGRIRRIRRMNVQGQPKHMVYGTPSPK